MLMFPLRYENVISENVQIVKFFKCFKGWVQSWQLLEDFSMVMDMTMLMYLVLAE